ncbi:MAG TPA: hypothetical protein VMG10_32735 [Gemmataceae bacterium]|nr:hypothetical protein [Gemmataceae bacterium]
MSAEAYTQEKILRGIRIYWQEHLGIEDSFLPDMRIDYHLRQEGWWEEIDLMDVAYSLERTFGFTCSRQEWLEYFGDGLDAEEWEHLAGPRLTFRGLADFIRERLEPISLEPITILGKPCCTAGIFRALERLASQVHPNVRRFAPSTPIRRCLRGVRLHRFWSRLRWIFEDQLPPPPEFHLSSRGLFHSLIFKLGVGFVVALWRRDLSGVLTGILTTFALLVPVGIIVAFINQRLNPLPEGIETFGDLARLLAAILDDQQSEAASCSTP